MVKKHREKKGRRTSEERAEDIVREIHSAIQLVPEQLEAWQNAALHASLLEKEGPLLKDLPGPSQPCSPDILSHKENLISSKREAYKLAEENGKFEVKQMKALLSQLQHLNECEEQKKLSQKMDRHELMQFLSRQKETRGVEASSLPLFISNDHPPELVGAIGVNDAYKLTKTDICAAYVEDMWILGQICGVTEKGWYEVRDIDDPEKAPVVLPRRRVIPLPKYRADPCRQSHALFPAGAWVLALYPQTTVFYKGIIEHPPSTVHEPYRLSFEDSTYATGFSPVLEVPQRYVLSFRDVAYKPREKKNSVETSEETEADGFQQEKPEEEDKKKKKKGKKKDPESVMEVEEEGMAQSPVESPSKKQKKRKPKDKVEDGDVATVVIKKRSHKKKEKPTMEGVEVEVKEEATSSRRSSLSEVKQKKQRVKKTTEVKEEGESDGERSKHERTASRAVCYRESFSDDDEKPRKKRTSKKEAQETSVRGRSLRSDRASSALCYAEQPSDDEDKARRKKQKARQRPRPTLSQTQNEEEIRYDSPCREEEGTTKQSDATSDEE